MDFGLSSEQEQLTSAERSWLSRHDPIARVRGVGDEAAVTLDPAALSHAPETGLLALLTADVGGSHVDLGVVCEVHGSAASSLPIAELALAAALLDTCGHPRAESAADGQFPCAVTRGPVAMSGSEGHLLVRGRSEPIAMAAELAAVVVVGRVAPSGHHGAAEYLAVIDAPTMTAMHTLDVTRAWSRVELHANLAPDSWVALPVGTVAAVEDALAVHRAFDALGGAARLLEMTVTYTGQRQQFGVPIGSFQAIKHHCANMALGVEAGRAALWAAALALDTAADAADRRRRASSGAAFAKAAASEVAQLALQVHGGIGFTWEHDLHLFMRRIKVDEAMNGSVAHHRAVLAAD
jgi:alkylation response protein AidB-like acyl-CoA dehydrogenase